MLSVFQSRLAPKAQHLAKVELVQKRTLAISFLFQASFRRFLKQDILAFGGTRKWVMRTSQISPAHRRCSQVVGPAGECAQTQGHKRGEQEGVSESQNRLLCYPALKVGGGAVLPDPGRESCFGEGEQEKKNKNRDGE